MSYESTFVENLIVQLLPVARCSEHGGLEDPGIPVDSDDGIDTGRTNRATLPLLSNAP